MTSHVARHAEGTPGPQGPTGPHRTGHRAGGRVRLRDLHPDRHDGTSLRQPLLADRQRHRGAGQRGAEVQGERTGRRGRGVGGASAELPAAPGRVGTRRPGGGWGAGRVRATGRQGRQGDHHRRSAHPGRDLGEGPGPVPSRGPGGPQAGQVRRDRGGRRDREEARPPCGRPGHGAPARPADAGNDRRALRDRFGRQPRWCHHRRIRSPHRADRAERRRPMGRHRGRREAGRVAERSP